MLIDWCSVLFKDFNLVIYPYQRQLPQGKMHEIQIMLFFEENLADWAVMVLNTRNYQALCFDHTLNPAPKRDPKIWSMELEDSSGLMMWLNESCCFWNESVVEPDCDKTSD